MTRYALVVGIADYDSLPSLTKPTRDAEAVAQRLEKHGDFQVERFPKRWNPDKNCYEVAQERLTGKQLGRSLRELFAFISRKPEDKELRRDRGDSEYPIWMGSGNSLTLVSYPPKQTPRKASQTFPYRGLQPFERASARFFFGRKPVIQNLRQEAVGGQFCAGDRGCRQWQVFHSQSLLDSFAGSQQLASPRPHCARKRAGGGVEASLSRASAGKTRPRA